MEVWAELTEPNPGMVSCTQGVETTALFSRICLRWVVYTATELQRNAPVFVPLQFWFCRNPGLALPLIALQYHEVKVITEFNTVRRWSQP